MEPLKKDTYGYSIKELNGYYVLCREGHMAIGHYSRLSDAHYMMTRLIDGVVEMGRNERKGLPKEPPAPMKVRRAIDLDV